MLSRVDQEGRIPDRSHTRGPSATSRRSTPGLDRRSAAKRSPSSNAEIAASDCNPRRRDVALDQLGHPAHLHATKRPDGLEDDQDAAWSRARWRSFTSPLAITTSKASSVQRYRAGTVWALPSLR